MKTKKRMNIFILFLGSLIAGFFIVPCSSEASELVEITARKTDSDLEVDILINGEYGNEIFKLAAPDRLVLDLSPIDTISSAPEIEINAFGVWRIRVARNQPDVARIVFDLMTPAVNYKIEKRDSGLKISFWAEDSEIAQLEEKAKVETKTGAEAKVVEKLEPVSEEKTAVQTEPESAKTAGMEKEAWPPIVEEAEKGFFIQLAGGVSTFLKTEAAFSETLTFYGRLAQAVEKFSLKQNAPTELSFGKYFRVDNVVIKAGLAVEYSDFKINDNMTFSIPSPLSPYTLRTATASRRFRTHFSSISAFGLFRLFQSNKWTLQAGPEIGIAFGECRLLNAITIEDKPPYANADLTISSITYEKKQLSSLRAGLKASLEYAFSKKLALALNLNAFYYSPEIKDRSSKFDMSQAEALLGIQYRF